MWRVSETNSPGQDDELATAVAGMLVASYSRPGDTIVSLGADPNLAGAAGAAGCTYRAATDLHDLATLEHIAGRIALVVLRWPLTGAGDHPAVAHDMFAACRQLLTSHGATVVTLSAAPTTDGFDQHGHLIIPAARDNGLTLICHVLTVTETTAGTADHRYPSPAATRISVLGTFRGVIRHHVLLFAIGTGPRD